MLRISYKDGMKNEEVLHRATVDRTPRKDTGFIEGKRARGGQRETYLIYLHMMKGMKPIERIHLAYEIDVWLQLSK